MSQDTKHSSVFHNFPMTSEAAPAHLEVLSAFKHKCFDERPVRPLMDISPPVIPFFQLQFSQGCVCSRLLFIAQQQLI